MIGSRSRAALLTMALGLAIVLLALLVSPRYRLLYNSSSSAPRGWYALVPTREIAVNTLVFVRLPTRARAIAAERGYLPSSVLLLKHVAAVQGDYVCGQDGQLSINGIEVGRAFDRDGFGRRLDRWSQCRALEEDELFLLGDGNPSSFDSRYFGPVNVAAVAGEAIPLWMR